MTYVVGFAGVSLFDKIPSSDFTKRGNKLLRIAYMVQCSTGK